jgi:hypothetical protein
MQGTKGEACQFYVVAPIEQLSVEPGAKLQFKATSKFQCCSGCSQGSIGSIDVSPLIRRAHIRTYYVSISCCVLQLLFE